MGYPLFLLGRSNNPQSELLELEDAYGNTNSHCMYKEQGKNLTSLLERVKRQDLTGASPLRRIVEC